MASGIDPCPVLVREDGLTISLVPSPRGGVYVEFRHFVFFIFIFFIILIYFLHLYLYNRFVPTNLKEIARFV